MERGLAGVRWMQMPQVHEHWEILPHGPVQTVDDGILTVTGTIRMPLVALERRMTVVRLADGTSLIYSAVALEESAMREIEALGEPRYLIVPGPAHRLDAVIFKQRYPRVQVITPPGGAKRVEAVVAVDATDVDFGDPDVTFEI